VIQPYGHAQKSVNSDMVVLPARESVQLLRSRELKRSPAGYPNGAASSPNDAFGTRR
jgi:hypothetical protein